MNTTQQAKAAVTCAVSAEPSAYGQYIRARGGGLFLDARWGQVMREAYGNEAFYLAARCDATVRGGLMLVLQKSRLFGTHLCSVPYLDASGIVADDASVAAALTQTARRLMDERRARWVELRQYIPIGQGLPQRTDKVTMRLELPGDEKDYWQAVGAKVRNQVRKAQKAGLTCGSDKGERLEEFYRVYARTMRDLGSPAHSRRFFEAVATALGPELRLYVVRESGRALAAALTLRDGWGGYVPWAGSDWRRSRDNPNMLLYWTMLSDACREGVRRFDLGRSTRGGGTYAFKAQWGAAEVPLYWQYLLPEGGAVPQLRADGAKFQFAEACWRRLPVSVASWLGPRIIRKLS